MRAADKVVEVVTKCFDMNDSKVHLLILKACLTAATSRACGVHKESLLACISTVHDIFMYGHNADNVNTAKVILRNVTRNLFERYAKLSSAAAAAVPPSGAGNAPPAASLSRVLWRGRAWSALSPAR